MTQILTLISPLLEILARINHSLLWLGRQVSWILIGAMVVVITIQVFFRYVLNAALPWPEELARVMMIWMMALSAPSAYRWGNFVAITMIMDALPHVLGRLLNILLTVMATCVLAFLLFYAIKHFNSGFIFKSSTLKIPLAYVYLSMSLCFGVMLSVNAEMILRQVAQLIGGNDRFPNPKMPNDLQGE